MHWEIEKGCTPRNSERPFISLRKRKEERRGEEQRRKVSHSFPSLIWSKVQTQPSSTSRRLASFESVARAARAFWCQRLRTICLDLSRRFLRSEWAKDRPFSAAAILWDSKACSGLRFTKNNEAKPSGSFPFLYSVGVCGERDGSFVARPVIWRFDVLFLSESVRRLFFNYNERFAAILKIFFVG